jgi:hypothetical protein
VHALYSNQNPWKLIGLRIRDCVLSPGHLVAMHLQTTCPPCGVCPHPPHEHHRHSPIITVTFSYSITYHRSFVNQDALVSLVNSSMVGCFYGMWERRYYSQCSDEQRQAQGLQEPSDPAPIR